MNSKKIINISLALLFAVSACKKSNVFEDPYAYITPDAAFSSPDKIEKSAVGMYDALQNLNFLCGRVLIYADQRGIDESPNSYFNNVGFLPNLTASDATASLSWRDGYNTIYVANNFLQNFQSKTDMVTADKANQYVGEAKFIRALCYTYLVNLWAQPYNKTWNNTDTTTLGVPLVLTASADPFAASNQVPRAKVVDVYSQIEADLLEAKDKLPAPSSDAFTRVARANKTSALALLSRIYLYEGKWQKASDYADSVMSYSSILKLNSSPELTFQSPYTSGESIFSVAMNGADNPNTNNSLGQHYGSHSRGDINVSGDYVALMDTLHDARYKKLIESYKGLFWTKKYPGITTDFVPVIRYAEVLLTKAEALARLNTAAADASALGFLNQVRLRSNSTLPVVAATPSALVDSIVAERRIELAFEGHGIIEFQRTGRALPAHYGIPATPWASQKSVMPIPDYDRQKNPNLAQNPGY
ncbi:RagB/SusD family nutrient uptake outer membrane protein [Pinibacter aurantiacus]|uniref:RagB/SusD family nutrient uptake outer membrane protein n=1 Tax=Pinibacter aurantiacus TaxID=2851599 RepID=A0A9E2SD78_9BACT|nr:RagB/SusD family nutrient uptake outer membrane protein [Pinibacter aurantiacus]MBV4359143.1 RagB/SusD family nutrient uptake outer membrane protein [Pinibacter aurantiacus]